VSCEPEADTVNRAICPSAELAGAKKLLTDHWSHMAVYTFFRPTEELEAVPKMMNFRIREE